MTIGIDAHNLEGNRTGVGRYLKNLLHEWSKLSFELKVKSLKFILYFKDEIPADLPKSPLFGTKLLKVRSTAKFIHWDLHRVAKRDRVDILFCPGYVAPIFWRGKLALTLHDIIYEARPKCFEWQSWADKILLKWVSKKSAQTADVIFTPSNFSKEDVIKYYHIKPDKIIVTPLGVDCCLTAGDRAAAADIKEKYGISDKFIFYVGSLFSRRHLPEIISAFLKLDRPDWQLLIGGRDYTDGRKIDKLSQAANERLSRQAILRVDLIGDSDLRLLYSACAFFIWLSDYEGFGLPPLEAMALAAPVITSDSTSLKEVAGRAALVIRDNNDVEEIYLAMKKLIDDKSLRRELSARGKEQAGKFSWERCAKETLDGLMSV